MKSYGHVHHSNKMSLAETSTSIIYFLGFYKIKDIWKLEEFFAVVTKWSRRASGGVGEDRGMGVHQENRGAVGVFCQGRPMSIYRKYLFRRQFEV